MLYDLTPTRSSQLPRGLSSVLRMSTSPERIGQGMYVMTHWNPEFSFAEKLLRPDDISSDASYEDWFESYKADVEQMEQFCQHKYGSEYVIHCYGVCDYPMQALEVMPWISDVSTKYALTFVEIRKEDQPSSGGWRWHKWGEYIGKQNPQYEYLYDENNIKKVYTFSLYQIES